MSEHITRAARECHALLVEPRGVVNTGEAGGALTAANDAGYSFSSDIPRRIEKDFGSEAPAVIAELEAFIESFRAMARTQPDDRVIRFIVHLANGRREDLAHYMKAALVDPRDVTYWAEYDRDSQRVRDCSMPFPDVA